MAAVGNPTVLFGYSQRTDISLLMPHIMIHHVPSTVLGASDSELWRAFQNGDEAAYTALYRAHVRAMYRYGISVLPTAEPESIVLDCIQDVFTEIWVKRSVLSVPDNARYYLLKALKTRLFHVLKRERTLQLRIDNTFEGFEHECSVEELITQQEDKEDRASRMEKLIGQLPARQQEVLRLRFVEELDYDQISVMLEINRQSAKNLVHRAVEKLREWVLVGFLIFLIFF